MLSPVSSPLRIRDVERVARRLVIAMLALVLATLPLLNGSFGASHDPLKNFAAEHGLHETEHAHQQADAHGFGDGHTHAHDAGDHSHETAFLPPTPIQPGAGPVHRPTNLAEVLATPVGGTRLDRPPKETVTV